MAQLFVSSMGLERRGRKPNCYSYSSPFPNPHQEWQIKPKFTFLVPEFWKRTCSSVILTKWNVNYMSMPLRFRHQSGFGSLQEKRHTPIPPTLDYIYLSKWLKILQQNNLAYVKW